MAKQTTWEVWLCAATVPVNKRVSDKLDDSLEIAYGLFVVGLP